MPDASPSFSNDARKPWRGTKKFLEVAPAAMGEPRSMAQEWLKSLKTR